jgi:ATP-dependent helicase HrpB
VEATWRLVYGEIAVEEERGGRGDPEKVAAVLADAALAKGFQAFAEPEELNRLIARVACAGSWHPEAALPALGDSELRAALQELCIGRRSFADLREVALLEALRGKLSFEQQRLLDQVAPEQLQLAGGRKARIEYTVGQPPWVESRLQDFCGLRQTPAVDRGRVPLVLHLLAPNKRAVQVTSDLAGFWERTYPAVRKELSRRYPRHQWPDDPRLPLPPRPPRRS